MSYKNTESYGFPSEFVSSAVKETLEYCRAYAQAIYNNKKLGTNFYERERERMIVNRKYADGMQSVQKYKQAFNVGEGDASYLNLDYTIIPIISKFVDLRVGEMLNREQRINAEAIDNKSKTDRDEARNRYLSNMDLAEFDKEINELSEGQLNVIPKGEFIPQDEEELDLHMQLNFKQATEIAIEEIEEFVFYWNNWEDKLKKRVIKDFLTIKKAAVKVTYDENFNIKYRYADFANLIVPFSAEEDGSDMHFVAEEIKVTIHELRRMGKGELTEEKLYEIARNFAGQNHGNNDWSYGSSFHNYYEQGVTGGYDDFMIPVLDCYWLSLNVKNFEEKSNNYGGFYYNEKPFGYEAPKNSKQDRKVDNKELEQLYKCKWIIGSDIAFDFGLAENAVRPFVNGKYSSKPQLPYIIAMPDQRDMEAKSMVERMIPHADEIQIINLKIQQLVAKLTPPGLAIDIDAVKDVMLGKGKKWTPLDIQEVYQALGTYYYKGRDEDGVQLNRPPIQEIKNSIGSVLQELIQLYNFHIQQIRDVTGLNEVRDASMPDKSALVGTQKLALQSSRNTTRDIDYAYDAVYKEIAERTLLMVQQNIKFNRSIELYENVIGVEKVKTLDFSVDFNAREFGIKIETMPDEEERMKLEQKVALSLQEKELRLEDAIMIESIPNVKLAYQYLILRRKKYAEEEQQQAQMNSQMQAQSAQQAAQAKMQADMAILQAEEQSKSRLLQLEYQLKMELARVEGEETRKHESLEGEYKTRHIKEASEEDFKSKALDKSTPQERVFSSPGDDAVNSI